MKKEDARKLVTVDPSLGETLEAHAADAFRDLWDRTVDNATLDPESRRVTPSAVKAAVEARLRSVLPSGTELPLVSVKVNAERTGFSIEITPGRPRYEVRQVR